MEKIPVNMKKEKMWRLRNIQSKIIDKLGGSSHVLHKLILTTNIL